MMNTIEDPELAFMNFTSGLLGGGGAQIDIKPPSRVLLVDDEPRMLSSLGELLKTGGYQLATAGSGFEAIDHLGKGKFDLVILDMSLPDMSGHEVMDFINSNNVDTDVIVVSGNNDIDSAIGALKRGAFDYLRKPFAREELLKMVGNVLKQRALKADNQRFAWQLESSERVYRYFVENSPDIIYTLNNEGMFTFVNNRVEQLLGLTRTELIGKHYSSLVHDEDNELAHYVFMERRVDERASRNIELRLKCHKGYCESRTFENSLLTISFSSMGMYALNQNDNNPEFLGTYGVARDITERKRVEENLRITASVFDISQEGIFITDAENNIIDVNPAFSRITGYKSEEVIGKNPGILSSGDQTTEFYEAMWQDLKTNKSWRGEIWNRRKNGEIYPEILSISVLCDAGGKVLRYVAVFSDISNLKRHEAELNRIAHFDALTGIPNRILLADRMRQAIAQTSREQNMMALCYLDLDGFKPINDTLGHQAGDEVLVEIARRIGDTIRGGDTSARLGGDEFVVLLLGLSKGEECVTTLERLLESISQPIMVGDKPVSVSASIGVSIYPMDDEDPDTLLRHADQAMYIAKQSGKNRFHIYDVSLDRRARDQNEFLKSIRYALEHDQFELHYQPKINLRTRELVGVEGLIRWRHPDRGLLSPAEFMRYIENTGLDIEIGQWVTATALDQIDQWRKQGIDIEISINISGYHLESPGFVEKLKDQLGCYPSMPFGKLQIEVLETVALNDINIVRGIIGACHELGVGFALDDFGTGYSSLSYLSGLPVDVLKIDQSFVRDMLEDKGDRAIVQGIIALAQAFERQTVAEGIETDAQYQMLLDMGCELGQGYAIARPMLADELTNWLAE
jgi:diguanylate cyclase (GGDEF)-like protein/PAS domain S-box-containing protein